MAKKVLFATDYSKASRNILPYAASLARDHGATLLIAHVLELEQYAQGEIVDESGEPSAEEIQRIKEVTPVGFDVSVEHKVVFGKPGSPDEAICQLARDESADMIVIGTHGESALEHLMGGSVAERVIKHAPCPVVAVKHF